MKYYCWCTNLPGHTLQTDLSQQHGKGNVVVVQHSPGHSVECHLISYKPDISISVTCFMPKSVLFSNIVL